MTKPVIRGVIFDCDGVLVDTETLACRVLTEQLCEYGCDMDMTKTHDLFIGGTLAMVPPKMKELFGITLPEDWLAECYERTFVAFRNDLEPFADLGPILDLLDHHGIPMAVGSNGPHNKMDVSLGKVGIKDRFGDRICSAHDVKNAKPHPDVYLLAAERMGLPITDCVVVDDSQNGVRAGVASGATTVGLVDITPAQYLRDAGAHFIANDHKDLHSLFESWITAA
ncbi:HAD family phosphatase [Thalassospira sp. MCCC 1A02491]|uniref:HAD family hydrolase n=1 Tax=Thalassospira sp. MCCC 1A02491 TaxID=1769751 RepID=UPI0007AD6AA0|nr:HAD family phosphatase [Thalassospira sp. MCCC 1A02491]KZB60379.1 haloacid dehalogenase [Thalassospira sp. MCCC 1A02491]